MVRLSRLKPAYFSIYLHIKRKTPENRAYFLIIKIKGTMRKIKFRAQDIASNKWLYGDLRHHKDDVCIFEQGGNKGEQVKRDTIGQFVGLKDKNGKEIYEGDIIKSTDYPFMDEGKTNYLGIVSCDTHDAIGEFFVMLYVTKESERSGISNFTNKSFYDLRMENVEVVGNIFDNKGMFRDSDDVIMLWYLED